MGNIGPMELILVAIIALVVIGPSKLPEAARSVGKGMREMRSAMSGDGNDDEARLDDAEDDEEEDEDAGDGEGEKGQGEHGEGEGEEDEPSSKPSGSKDDSEKDRAETASAGEGSEPAPDRD